MLKTKEMNRRNFIKRSSLATGGLFFVPQFVKAFEQNTSKIFNPKKVVIVQLKGGNDGLNTIIPFRNDIYYQKRKDIGIKNNNIIKLTDDIGMHKNLSALKKLYDNGYLSILNNVGYPNPNRSHFRSTDIWQTASNSNEYLQTGWIGRFLDSTQSQPYNAIEVDESLSLMLKGKLQNGLAVTNPKLLYQSLKQPFFGDVISHYKEEHLSEHNLGYLYNTMIDAKSSAAYIYEKSNTNAASATYPNNVFGKQLKTIAQFINSGLETQVYYAALSGFDTHANQHMKQGRLLKIYAESMAHFVKDLETANKFDDVLILTFSEFGRRVQENAAKGTDHGTANNVFIIGKNLKNQNKYMGQPDLVNLDFNGDLQYEIDFREVYATVLDRWLGVDDAQILNKDFSKLHFL